MPIFTLDSGYESLRRYPPPLEHDDAADQVEPTIDRDFTLIRFGLTKEE